MPRSMVGAAIAIAIAGCAGPGSGPNAEDVLFLRAGGGITLVRDLPEGNAVRVRGAVPSTDWSALVRAIPNGSRTRVVALDAATGVELWTREVPGRLEVKVAGDHGRLVALGDPRRAAGYPRGRSSTTLVISGRDLPEPRTVELQGNYEPEAFATDGRSLFVVEYLPPQRPTRYRVRRLDLRTEEVLGVYTVDAHLQGAMRGTARIQASSRDGRRLYTLYTLLGPEGTMRAFVHVLSLDELWAHCVDLPSSFANARETQIALSLSPDGSRLYAADASTGTVAEVDTQALTVTRTAEADFGSGGGPTHAVTAPDGRLYLAKGTSVVALDTAAFRPRRSWDMAGRITGVQSAIDGRRLYVGLRDRIMVVDAATGDLLPDLDPDNVDAIEQLGPSTRFLDLDRTGIKCAC